MLIKITQDHIDKGQKNNCSFCPIALAASQIFGESVSVGLALLASKVECYLLPKIASDFIYDFDSGKEVKSFEFELGEMI